MFLDFLISSLKRKDYIERKIRVKFLKWAVAEDLELLFCVNFAKSRESRN